jgi:hypothetical protein
MEGEELIIAMALVPIETIAGSRRYKQSIIVSEEGCTVQTLIAEQEDGCVNGSNTNRESTVVENARQSDNGGGGSLRHGNSQNPRNRIKKC